MRTFLSRKVNIKFVLDLTLLYYNFLWKGIKWNCVLTCNSCLWICCTMTVLLIHPKQDLMRRIFVQLRRPKPEKFSFQIKVKMLNDKFKWLFKLMEMCTSYDDLHASACSHHLNLNFERFLLHHSEKVFYFIISTGTFILITKIKGLSHTFCLWYISLLT